jgi:hypothetical protein
MHLGASDLFALGQTLKVLLLDWSRYHAFQAALLPVERAQLLSIGMWCSQMEPRKRPSLAEVYTELGRVVGGLPLSEELADSFGTAVSDDLIRQSDHEREQHAGQAAAAKLRAEEWALLERAIASRCNSSTTTTTSSSTTCSNIGSSTTSTSVSSSTCVNLPSQAEFEAAMAPVAHTSTSTLFGLPSEADFQAAITMVANTSTNTNTSNGTSNGTNTSTNTNTSNGTNTSTNTNTSNGSSNGTNTSNGTGMAPLSTITYQHQQVSGRQLVVS